MIYARTLEFIFLFAASVVGALFYLAPRVKQHWGLPAKLLMFFLVLATALTEIVAKKVTGKGLEDRLGDVIVDNICAKWRDNSLCQYSTAGAPSQIDRRTEKNASDPDSNKVTQSDAVINVDRDTKSQSRQLEQLSESRVTDAFEEIKKRDRARNPYIPLIDSATKGLNRNTKATRKALYDRAETALLSKLSSLSPPLADIEIEREQKRLREAITIVEETYK